MVRQRLDISTPSAREIRIERSFRAPCALVFEAFTRPEFLRRWLYGPDGWAFDECEVDLRVGGAYRYVWVRAHDGKRMGASGIFREIVAPVRIVSSERFDDAWYPGDAQVTLEFSERAPGLTKLTQTLSYESEAARDMVLRSPMDQGLAAGYDRLAALLEAA